LQLRKGKKAGRRKERIVKERGERGGGGEGDREGQLRVKWYSYEHKRTRKIERQRKIIRKMRAK
jgi:hypothetical protein